MKIIKKIFTFILFPFKILKTHYEKEKELQEFITNYKWYIINTKQE